MGRVEVTQGEIKVDSIDLILNTPEVVIYKINTRQKRPAVISWGMCSITMLERNTYEHWLDKVRPEDYTVIRFPEVKDTISSYFEERYCVYFMQFNEQEWRTIWPQA